MVVVEAFIAGAGLATGMGQLDAGDGPVLLEEAGNASKRLHMVIQIYAAVGGADAAFWRNGGGLDHDQPSAADRTGTKMDEVPVVREAIVRRILAHGGDGDTVSQNNVLQSKLLKKTCHHAPSGQM